MLVELVLLVLLSLLQIIFNQPAHVIFFVYNYLSALNRHDISANTYHALIFHLFQTAEAGVGNCLYLCNRSCFGGFGKNTTQPREVLVRFIPG